MAEQLIYHEKQSKMLCAVHALNNLLQDPSAFSKASLDHICCSLSPDTYINPHKNPLGLGNYDVNVLIAALTLKDYETIWFDKRMPPNSLCFENILGLIINKPSSVNIAGMSLPIKRPHWFAANGNTRKGRRNGGPKNSGLQLRLARQDDYQNVLELSMDIFSGDDNIPVVFHDWLNIPNMLMVMAELHEKAVGFSVGNIVSDGKTIFTRSLRVHPEYRGRGLGLEIEVISSVKDYVRQMFPRLSKKHYFVPSSNTPSMKLALKLRHKIKWKLNFHRFEITKASSLLPLVTSRCQMLQEYLHLCLYPYDTNTAAAIVSNENALRFITPENLMTRDWLVCEAIPANIKHLFKRDDNMFADITAQELLHKCKTPRSFSSGCLSPRFQSMSWICTVYTNDMESLTAHVLRQLESAASRIDQDFTFLLNVCSKISSFDERKVLKQELGRLNQKQTIISDIVYLFEDVFD